MKDEKYTVLDDNGEPTQEKVRGCSKCKKKKVIKKLDNLIVDDINIVPTDEQIKLAYFELTNQKGVQEDKKPLINYIYRFLFKEEFDWGCNSCGNQQARKLQAYCINKKIKI